MLHHSYLYVPCLITSWYLPCERQQPFAKCSSAVHARWFFESVWKEKRSCCCLCGWFRPSSLRGQGGQGRLSPSRTIHPSTDASDIPPCIGGPSRVFRVDIADIADTLWRRGKKKKWITVRQRLLACMTTNPLTSGTPKFSSFLPSDSSRSAHSGWRRGKRMLPWAILRISSQVLRLAWRGSSLQ